MNSPPRWCNGQRACHWTQGLWVQSRSWAMNFNGDKIRQKDFLQRGSKEVGLCRKTYGLLKIT
jgi:hypothetical protein